MVTSQRLTFAPQFFAVEPQERTVSVASQDAYTLVGFQAVTDDPQVTARKLYMVGPATVQERMALLKPGRRICSC